MYQAVRRNRKKVGEKSRTVVASSKSLRLRPELRAEIERICQRTRRSFSEVAQDLLDEALRMRNCPGIYFGDEPSGREAKVAGTGLGVWEVIRDYTAARGDRRKVSKALPHLSEAGLRAALIYYERHPKEIDLEIAENARLTPEYVETHYPGLLRRR